MVHIRQGSENNRSRTRRGWALPAAAVFSALAAVIVVEILNGGVAAYVVALLLAVLVAVVFGSLERGQLEDQRALEESEELYRLATHATNEAIWDSDLRPGGELSWRGAAEGMFGYRLEEPKKGAWWEERVHPADRGRVLSGLDAILSSGEDVWADEYRFRCGDGRYARVSDRGYVVRDPSSGEPVRMIGSMADVTERARTEEALRESERRFRRAFDRSSVGIALVSLDGRWLEVNRALCEIVGYSEEELLGRTLQDITHPDDVEADAVHVRRLLSGEIRTYRMDKRYLHKLGREVWINLSISLVRDAPGEPLYFVAQIQDINDRKTLENQLAHRAFHDALTGLPNRALFMDRLEHALARTNRRNHSVAVLFMDLNGFKAVNDTLGHEAGDELLVAVAERLEGCLRAGDTAARLGGDEFTILLEDVSGANEPVRVAERIAQRLAEPFSVGGEPVVVGASVGIAIGGDAFGEEKDLAYRSNDLMRQADQAMYRAKRRGEAGHQVYDASMNEKTIGSRPPTRG